MRYGFLFLAASIFMHCVACSAQVSGDGFVLVEGGTFRHGAGAKQSGTLARVEDFEILDHPVTNAEYKAFVDTTGHTAPLHCVEGRIPAATSHAREAQASAYGRTSRL